MVFIVPLGFSIDKILSIVFFNSIFDGKIESLSIPVTIPVLFNVNNSFTLKTPYENTTTN